MLVKAAVCGGPRWITHRRCGPTEVRRVRALLCGDARELGDVLWYVANVAHEIGVSLETVARANVNKLNDRKVRGKISGNGDER